jgi:WD40 repeat protein
VFEQGSKTTSLLEFLLDTRRFILTNQSIIKKAPLQTYCSALIFTTEKSCVKEIYKGDMLRWIVQVPQIQADWGAALARLEGHSMPINTIAFLLDGQKPVSLSTASRPILSAGYGKNVFMMWDVESGTELNTLEIPGPVSAIVFPPGSKRVSLGTLDGVVLQEEAVVKLKGNDKPFNYVAFSSDGSQMASCSENNMIRL